MTALSGVTLEVLREMMQLPGPGDENIICTSLAKCGIIINDRFQYHNGDYEKMRINTMSLQLVLINNKHRVDTGNDHEIMPKME